MTQTEMAFELLFDFRERAIEDIDTSRRGQVFNIGFYAIKIKLRYVDRIKSVEEKLDRRK